ncbi:MAG TPA: ATP-binding protein, partial [Burkholderiaceae bacterium]|nr:ATP-binding protein [Burkholderiaceae bacterium]
EAVRLTTIDAWIEELLQRWRLQRPVIEPSVRLQGSRPGPRLAIDATLGQAMLNLFNNAADASPDKVEIEGSWDDKELRLRVLDRGAGISGDVQGRLGRDVVSTRGEGRGMGLVLAYAAIERSGGQLRLDARKDGGTMAQVCLPLGTLHAPAGA